MPTAQPPVRKRGKGIPRAASLERRDANGRLSPLSTLNDGLDGEARAPRWLGLGLILFAFLALISCIPLGTAVQIGADEGFEFSKAALQTHGYKLYSEVWNDQPPLHTFIVAKILATAGSSPFLPRLLSVLFGAALLGALFSLVARFHGRATAIIASALLLVAPAFLELSSSCMLELPAHSTAILALAFLSLSQTLRASNALAAGIAFGFAVAIKLVVVILAPVAVMLIVSRSLGSQASQAKLSLRSAGFHFVFFSVAAAAAFLSAVYLIDGGAFISHFNQSWSSHFAAGKSYAFGSASDHPFEWAIFARHWDTSLPAVIALLAGIPFLSRSALPARAAFLLPFAWLAIVVAIFAVHRPWWSYYYLHIATPLCWCAAVGVAYCWRAFSHLPAARRFALAVVAAAAVLWAGGRVFLQVSDMRALPKTGGDLVLQEIMRFKPFAKHMFADRIIYSFYSGVPLVPNLAVLPLKRLWAGDVTADFVQKEMIKTRPELILIEADGKDRPFSALLASDYNLVFDDARQRLYARRDVAQRAKY